MEHIEPPISDNLKAARRAQNLSLDQLSARSGVSKSMLRQIEVGRSNPTIGVLWKIANGLKLPFSSLLRKSETDTEVADFTGATQIKSGRRGYRLYPLVAFQPDRPLEAYYVEIDAGVSFDGEPHHRNARETIYVIAGSIELTMKKGGAVAGERQYLQFLAGEGHRYRNPGKKTARLIMSIDYAAQ